MIKLSKKNLHRAIIIVAVTTLNIAPLITKAQLFYNNGADILMNVNATVQVNGDLSNNGIAGNINNNGDVTIVGDITNNATAGGNGDYHVSGDWINNATFNCGTGSVELNGANQQITGTQSTYFYDLLLTGTGVKTLTINTYDNNLLELNDRELATGAFTMYILSTDINAITRTSGFVSSLTNGTLSRVTAQSADYLFPTGSSLGTLRYRPIIIKPATSAVNTYTVRLANNDATNDTYDRSLIDSNICETNEYFYHHIQRSAGTDAADISINFDSGTDGNWDGIANWDSGDAEWQGTGQTTVASGYVTKTAWNDFTYAPYILTRKNADATIDPVGNLCSNNPQIILTSQTSGGTWTGQGITNTSTGAFSPASAGVGTHIISYDIAGNCGGNDTIAIKVVQVGSITSSHNDESCLGANDGNIDITMTGGTSPYSYVWDNGETTEDLENIEPGSYIVLVSDGNNCVVSHTVDVYAGAGECQPEVLYLPNIFSPNGDGNNDILFVRGEGVKTVKVTIYDRWGEKIFEITDMTTGWDGTFRGKPMDPAVYVYYIDAEMNSGTIIKDKGNITLLR